VTRRSLFAILGFAVAAAALWAVLFVAIPNWFRTPDPGAGPQAPAPAAPVDPSSQRKITATLYFISEDGMSLVPVQREIPHGEAVVAQARHIVEAQLATAPEPLASPIPSGTTLRAIYLSERGDMFVDLSPQVTTNHTGGALDELFTVYALVNALTVNLPAIQRVQLLIDGKETDTLAGHVDLRNPLSRNMNWVKTENP
jgi:spore germination protein GerM